MKKALQKVLKDKKGFTLAELLIVVAIIAILVAVSIPIFTSQLNNSKAKTDEANERAAKAAAVAAFFDLPETPTADVVYNYDAEAGKVYINSDKEATAIESYGKTNGHSGCIVQITISKDGTVAEPKWVTGKASSSN